MHTIPVIVDAFRFLSSVYGRRLCPCVHMYASWLRMHCVEQNIGLLWTRQHECLAYRLSRTAACRAMPEATGQAGQGILRLALY